MLRVGRDRLTDAGQIVPAAVCDAERLPFPTGYFDRVSVAFGLRNMTHKDRALAEMTGARRAASCWCWNSPASPAAGAGL